MKTASQNLFETKLSTDNTESDAAATNNNNATWSKCNKSEQISVQSTVSNFTIGLILKKQIALTINLRFYYSTDILTSDLEDSIHSGEAC